MNLRGGAGASPHAWFVGGVLLLSTVVFSVATYSTVSMTLGGVLTTTLFAGALLLFAYGFRRSESVTGRRPLGTAALTLLAVWVLCGAILTDILAVGFPDAMGPVLSVFGTVNVFVQFGLSLIAVVQIGRTGVVPLPWRWMPAYVLAGLTIVWVLTSIVVATADQETANGFVLLISVVDGLVRVGGTVLLGVGAIVLADRTVRRVPSRDPSTIDLTGSTV